MLHYCTEVLCQWTLSFVRSVAGGEAEGRRAQEKGAENKRRSHQPIEQRTSAGLVDWRIVPQASYHAASADNVD